MARTGELATIGIGSTRHRCLDLEGPDFPTPLATRPERGQLPIDVVRAHYWQGVRLVRDFFKGGARDRLV